MLDKFTDVEQDFALKYIVELFLDLRDKTIHLDVLRDSRSAPSTSQFPLIMSSDFVLKSPRDFFNLLIVQKERSFYSLSSTKLLESGIH